MSLLHRNISRLYNYYEEFLRGYNHGRDSVDFWDKARKRGIDPDKAETREQELTERSLYTMYIGLLGSLYGGFRHPLKSLNVCIYSKSLK